MPCGSAGSTLPVCPYARTFATVHATANPTPVHFPKPHRPARRLPARPEGPTNVRAYLVLSDGTVYEGTSLGAAGETTGEVVFNTGMT
ncbi:MAG TPA: carbamoyl-phosphate synthase domain-containing protein, partial [Fimbriimonadaceae bacterium]|nr:carbamoyl-phosphate synthase domain-containing protein [Fimbriimonadaceae bacterium]